MNIRSGPRALARALVLSSAPAFVWLNTDAWPDAAVVAASASPMSSYDPDDDFPDPDDSTSAPDDQNDTPLTRFICRLGIGHWRHPLADAITEYVWATDFNEADRKARDDHPTTPPFEYISWSRCDPA